VLTKYELKFYINISYIR